MQEEADEMFVQKMFGRTDDGKRIIRIKDEDEEGDKEAVSARRFDPRGSI
jgi:hypothetical protein